GCALPPPRRGRPRVRVHDRGLHEDAGGDLRGRTEDPRARLRRIAGDHRVGHALLIIDPPRHRPRGRWPVDAPPAFGLLAPVIRLRDVHKHYRQGETEVAAVDGVSLDVPRGAFLAVMGPSGSGKSTLLQLIAGLDPPTSGEIAIDDRPLHRMPDDELTVFRRRHVGIVFQFFNLLPTLTAEENVGLPLVLDGFGARAVRPRALAMLERVGLAHRRRHFPDQLSGGEMQRVAIARALVTEPLV